MLGRFGAFLLGALLCLPAAARGVLPVCPPDWKLEIVAAAPQIKHPSVVCCAPDGRVFVAEDPMDISAPSANLALGRILCFHPDGRTTVFAERLYAVFGMQYLDGKLYVLHNPKFSVFTDDNGVGKERADLIESTHPNPWALDWNDHVPANFRLAMDGYLYVAVGDKGVYGAVGRDGKRVDLHGGGILRMRPDGTALEVFCTGVRNILDVAINAEDEIFTYDNTDEQQWMSRVTHMVDGGFYGYPYDFIPRRPYTLWCMADYGGGAATGGLCYNEDALPAEYQGNLFLADFGKRQLLRLRIARDGATYKVVEKQDFFSDVPGDFRPVGIALSPDGLSIYICDWNHADTKENVIVGRLLKLSYAGKSHDTPKPGWYVPAARGRKFTATFDDLLKGLSHPAQSVRLVAQRRIVERLSGAKEARLILPVRSELEDAAQATGIGRLKSLLTDSTAASCARWHALWALDAIDEGRSARKEILRVLDDPDLSVRRQAMRQLGSRRAREAAELLRRQLKAGDASLRFQAATASGRIGEASVIPALFEALDDSDLFTRYAVFTAMNRISKAERLTWDATGTRIIPPGSTFQQRLDKVQTSAAIVKGLESENTAICDGTVFALRETYEEPLVRALAGIVRDRDKPAHAREAALNLLAGVHRKKPEWKGEWWAYHPVNAPPPVKTVEWAGTATVLNVLQQMLDDVEPRIRKASVEGLAQAKDTESAPKLRALFAREKDAEIKRAVLRALAATKDSTAGELIAAVLDSLKQDRPLLSEAVLAAERIGGRDVVGALVRLLASGYTDDVVLFRAVEVLGNLKAKEASAALAARARDDPRGEIRLGAIQALGKVGGEAALETLRSLLNDPTVEIRRASVSALGRMKARAALPDLLKAVRDSAAQDEAITALTQMPDLSALDAYFEGLASKNASLREQCRKAIAAIQDAALPIIEERATQLTADVVAELQRAYEKNEKARNGKLFAVATKQLGPAAYEAFALKNTGAAGRGRTLFFDSNGVACIKCHAVGSEGGKVGPDLTTIGSQFARASLIEQVLYPSKAVREGYQQVIVETRDGESLSGLAKAESADELTLLDAEARLHPIRKADIAERRNSALSLMPEGLQYGLTVQEFADLISYLESLKTVE